jgi:hypothetical protein
MIMVHFYIDCLLRRSLLTTNIFISFLVGIASVLGRKIVMDLLNHFPHLRIYANAQISSYSISYLCA